MTTTRLSDNRELESTTVTEADEKFARLARLEINIKAARAAADKRIASIKAGLQDKTEADQEEYTKLFNWMEGYINANKGRFAKPRQRKTEWGKYGLHTAAKLKITDTDAVIRFAELKELPLFTVKKTVDKKEVEKAISGGVAVPGARIVSGDLATMKVEKKLLDAALK